MSSLPLISIIVPTYNESAILPCTLKAVVVAIEICMRETRCDAEVIVTDDGSKQNSASMIQEQFPNVKYLWHENLGRGPNRNYGASMAAGDILVFLDADVILSPNALKDMINLMFSEGDITTIVFGNIKLALSPRPTAFERYLENKWDKYIIRFKNSVNPIDAYSGFFAMHGTFFNELSGFSSRFRHYGGEDTEFFVRASLLNSKLLFCQNAVGWHHHDFGLESNLRKRYWSAYSSVIISKQFGLEVVTQNRVAHSHSLVGVVLEFLTKKQWWRKLKFLHTLFNRLGDNNRFARYFYPRLFQEYWDKGLERAQNELR
jgi:glycosyltransferase involved in cell wall biosynthesis